MKFWFHVNTTLKVLNLSDNKLEKYGVHEIVDALRNNNTITSLNIECNDLYENEEQLGDFFKVNNSIECENKQSEL
jgi:hypothetical protein